MTTVTEIIAKSKLSCETSFKNESPKSIFNDSHTRQARGRLNPPFRGAYFRRRSSALFLAKHSISRAGYLPKSYFKWQEWQQSQRSYFTTSKCDDSYRDRTWPLPKATTVSEIVIDHFQKRRQLQRSYLTTSQSDDSYRDRNWPLPKVTTVTEIVLDHFQKWRQLQRSYLTTSKSDDSHRDHRQIEAFVRDFLQKRISKVNFWRQSHEASPRQARGRLNPPFRGAYFRRRSSALFLAKHSISRAGYLPKSYFKWQEWQQSQRSYFTTSKSDDSYRDRTWPLPKATTVTEIVIDHFQKRRQLQRSYLTTSQSDDSYRDRNWPLPKVTTVTEIVLDHFQKWRQLQRSYLTTSKSDDSHRDHRQIEAFVRDFLQKRISKVNFWRQSHEASPRQARGRLNPPFRGAYFRRRSSALFLAKHQHFASRLSTQIILPSCKNDNSHRDRISPLPNVTTVTEIVLDHFQKRRQLQRS